MYSVGIQKLIDHMDLTVCTPEVDLSKIKITHTDVNRPALQLTGFFDYFDNERIQVIGHVENLYMHQSSEDEGTEMLRPLFERGIPGLVYCRGIEVPESVIALGNEYHIPVLATTRSTTSFIAEVTRWLNVELAPRISIHGVLINVYGEGVLITGESGIGKSEAALELIKRGHRLVSDDVVELRRVSAVTLIGMAPDVTRHLIELRGIGIVDVKSLFGVASVMSSQTLDLVINLSEYDRDVEYDRLGLEEKHIEYMGIQVPCHNIPIRPGRNVAIIVESAAINHRQKKLGYNAAEELYRRVTQNLQLDLE
ncbi:MAG: HPr(Ser) kinase/phosphatase [Lachnospiraceae bacterium]|nr:HPr(Ser) kinase/phosphatase [Lachnospiraceae bacterium]